ncbi:MAG: GDP-L-fucose synthase [Ilumatobacteraceae bacterium]
MSLEPACEPALDSAHEPAPAAGSWHGVKVVVTGGSGFLGRVVVEKLRARGADVVAPRSADYDLTVPGTAEQMLADHHPRHVIHLAARVGGIGYNQVAPAPLYLDNLMMGTYVIEAARTAASQPKTTLVGTVCSYPKFTPVPFHEASLWDGYPEETNAPYGIAKKALLIHAQVNAQQYGQQFVYLIPTNLYGPGDKFHPSVSHVIPALIKKCVEAQESGADKIDVWGTGRASREYLFVEDAAEAIVLAAAEHVGTDPINLGNDHEVTIRETIETIAELVGFKGELVWDPSKPDGQPRRRVSADRAEALLGWRAQVAFDDGLRRTLGWYRANRGEAERDPNE